MGSLSHRKLKLRSYKVVRSVQNPIWKLGKELW